MIDPTSPPNPQFSANEKLLVQRNQLWTPNAMSQYLEEEGVDTETAGKIGRAFARIENESRYEYKQLIDELQRWANIHTHPGGTDSLFVPALDIEWEYLWEANDQGNIDTFGYVDGDALDKNGSGGWLSISDLHPFQASIDKCVWRDSLFNGLPCFEIKGSTNTMAATLAAVIPQPYSIVMIFKFTVTDPRYVFHHGNTLYIDFGADDYTLYAGTTSKNYTHPDPPEVAVNMEPHLTEVGYNGIDTFIRQDENFLNHDPLIDPGVQDGSSSIYLGSTTGGSFITSMQVALIGIKATKLTDVEYQDMLDYSARYGTA